MKKITKKLLALLLASVITLGSLPVIGMTEASAATSLKVGDIIEFGSYPQTEITDTALLSTLNSQPLTWVSYGYFSGNGQPGSMTQSDYMKYADVVYNDEKYRAVTFSQYRPRSTYGIALDENTVDDYYVNYTVQDNNGYYTNSIYWFKYEPIKWRVLNPNDGLVMSEAAIDSQPFNNMYYWNDINYDNIIDFDEIFLDSEYKYYSNNYPLSSVRNWLNNNFYSLAFSSSEKALIKTTEIDNLAGYDIYNNGDSSKYDCENTYDKVYLLSVLDVENSAYGFNSDPLSADPNRLVQGTDYAKCQGLYFRDGETNPRAWILRSPAYYSRLVCSVIEDGSSARIGGDETQMYTIWVSGMSDSGIRPAMKININSVVSYNANGGSGAPAAQTKQYGVNLTLSSTVPTKKYTVSYNANGGSISPTSKIVSCTFRNWNTAQNGSGTTYAPGSSYTANSGATLYAQWGNPTYGTLPTPARTGYTFDGWYTSASGGTKITSSSTITANTTIYAHWNKSKEDIYNLGEETYSFKNFGDSDSPGGHCFGMSVTSAGYYTEELDITDVGGNYEQDVYALKRSTRVDAPICYYQPIQHSYSTNAMVAGGTNYKNRNKWDIASDWNEVINYVKNHSHDNKGDLQIGFRGKYDYYGTAKEGGHAINFLRYEEVNGQPRIYAYDNNFPDTETYFYKDSNGNIKQAPKATFDISIDCIALRSIPKYFDLAADYDSTRYIYAEKDSIAIEGLDAYLMDGSTEMGSTVMFEVPAGVNQITIVPLVDNAEFEYLDESYSFGAVDDDTVGVFTLASSNDEGGVSSPSLTIKNESKSIWEMILDFFKMLLGLIVLPFSFLF